MTSQLQTGNSWTFFLRCSPFYYTVRILSNSEEEYCSLVQWYTTFLEPASFESCPQSTVDRVLGFFFSRPNCDLPTPSPAGECVPLPFRSGGGDTAVACWRGSGGVPIRTWGQTLCYSRYICTLWLYQSTFTEIHSACSHAWLKSCRAPPPGGHQPTFSLSLSLLLRSSQWAFPLFLPAAVVRRMYTVTSAYLPGFKATAACLIRLRTKTRNPDGISLCCLMAAGQ